MVFEVASNTSSGHVVIQQGLVHIASQDDIAVPSVPVNGPLEILLVHVLARAAPVSFVSTMSLQRFAVKG